MRSSQQNERRQAFLRFASSAPMLLPEKVSSVSVQIPSRGSTASYKIVLRADISFIVVRASSGLNSRKGLQHCVCRDPVAMSPTYLREDDDTVLAEHEC